MSARRRGLHHWGKFNKYREQLLASIVSTKSVEIYFWEVSRENMLDTARSSKPCSILRSGGFVEQLQEQTVVQTISRLFCLRRQTLQSEKNLT